MVESDSKKINGEIFNICAENISIRNLAYKVKEIIPCEIEYVDVKEDDRNYRVSSQKARWLLNYEPLYNISSGVMDMAQKIEENGFDDWDTNDLYYNHKVC
jgi:nucleoside-diphosphate-sugar epimerase